nr:MAG TPA: elongation factor [Caudoviricetes sp.]DAX48624.1 MAG TPA: elongation factor [Caudoviricetes sp.]
MSSDRLRKVLKGLISGKAFEHVIAELVKQNEE